MVPSYFIRIQCLIILEALRVLFEGGSYSYIYVAAAGTIRGRVLLEEIRYIAWFCRWMRKDSKSILEDHALRSSSVRCMNETCYLFQCNGRSIICLNATNGKTEWDRIDSEIASNSASCEFYETDIAELSYRNRKGAVEKWLYPSNNLRISQIYWEKCESVKISWGC